METKILQLSSGKGPAECCLAVALCLQELLKEVRQQGFKAEVLTRDAGEQNGTLQSATVKLVGQTVNHFVQTWCGTVLWIAQSPYRKFHKRKNWFVGVVELSQADLPTWRDADVTYQTLRASGPGGQHVNKTESAVRAIHGPSGLSVTASDSRSQLQNKKLATERLKEKFAVWQQSGINRAGIQQPRDYHMQLERGNAKRVYKGKEFVKAELPG